jgi:hypothetical protein
MKTVDFTVDELRKFIDIFQELGLDHIMFSDSDVKLNEEVIPAKPYSDKNIIQIFKVLKKRDPEGASEYIDEKTGKIKSAFKGICNGIAKKGISFGVLKNIIEINEEDSESVYVNSFSRFDSLRNIDFQDAPLEILDIYVDLIHYKVGETKSKKAILKNFKLSIPSNFPEKYNNVVEAFKESKTWYEQIKNTINSILSDKEASTLIAMLGITSAQKKLPVNLETGIDFYLSYENDLKNNNKLLKEFFGVFLKNYKNLKPIKKELPSIESGEKIDKNWKDDYTKLETYRYIKFRSYTDIPSLTSLCNHLLTTSDGYISKKDLIKVLESSIKKGGKLVDNYIIGGYKIFNFCLNLLTGGENYKFNVENTGFEHIPVTLDTWMIKFFFIDLSEDDPESIFISPKELKRIKMDVFANTANLYTYMHRKLVSWSNQIKDLKPEELQAVLWVYIYCKDNNMEGKEYSFLSVLDESLKSTEEKIDEGTKELQRVYDMLKKIEAAAK